MTESFDMRKTALRQAQKYAFQIMGALVVTAFLARWSSSEPIEWIRYGMMAPAGVCAVFGPIAFEEGLRLFLVVRNIDHQYINPNDNKFSGWKSMVVRVIGLFLIVAFILVVVVI